MLRTLAVSITAAFLWAGMAEAERAEIFALGVKDNVFTEFARNPETANSVVYRVGEDSPGKSWPAYQPGSFDAAVGRSTMERDWTEVRPGPEPKAFEIHFRLPGAPQGTFILRLDAIFRYRRPAPPRYHLLLNGKFSASYRLAPTATPELWWPNGGEAEGNTQYFGYQSLEMLLPAGDFRVGENTLAMQCLDGFGIYYDHLSLENDASLAPAAINAAFLEPTVLYKKKPSGLVELARLTVRTSRALRHEKVTLKVGKEVVDSTLEQSEAGDAEIVVEVPETGQPTPAAIYLGNSKKPIFEGTFTPKRRWQVYALPMEQADFGYNDLPARTLEWENRFIDKSLEIQRRYPSYSFTLDAAANLESYLETRDETHGAQLLKHLRGGKWGINALYANFFTGLSTPEELYRTLDYSLRAGNKYDVRMDSASQTDEPSITWALPQVLADAGIQYFTNGSDPIRGALNPIGLLNFQSPFYWEAPTGAKVLMWSGVSYTAVDDMTWGGWSPEAAHSGSYSTSTFGLTRSLPLFLSQYEREDFPFDAVLLFGLHNDEIPMRHWGDADVIEQWNREYAYPRLIAGTQRDFFGHITDNFAGKIKTLRGDGGAYWEDEAGADARIAAMIRTAQTQLTAAEKFESIASWLQPHLKFDSKAYDAAWKNILLADSYVWSDANSFRRPESYRTRGGEAAHRAWAEAALQQSSDLRLVAMDKVAEQVASDQPGAVVFNPEPWPRSDLFDFELEPDQVLTDASNGRAIPCGVTKSHQDYSDVRCWAENIPGTGYRFFAAAKGKTSSPQIITLADKAPAIENSYYRVELDPVTGAVSHLIDKATGLDLANQNSEHRLNEYLYVTGGDPGSFLTGNLKDNRLLAADVTLPLPSLELQHAAMIGTPVAQKFPWGTVLTVRSKAFNTPEIVSTITLLDTRKEIRFHNSVEKVSTLKKEGVYFAFPFSLKNPEVSYQGATAWVNPERDMLPGANRQWFTTQGGVWLKGGNSNIAWATVDAPLITLEDINRGLWPESIKVRNGSVFSYAMNNYWYTDTPAQQDGKFVFRYALTSGPDLSPELVMTLSTEQRSPLAVVRHYNMGWTPALAASGTGFVAAQPAGINILTVRPLDRGAYFIRVQNTTAEPVNAQLEFPVVDLEEAYLGSVVGEKESDVAWKTHSVNLTMGKYEIRTLVIRPRRP